MATTVDAAAKQAVKDALIARVEQALAVTSDLAEVENDAAEVVTEDTTSIDDGYQAEQAADMSELLDDAAERRAADLEELRALDVSSTDEVRPGAAVEVGGVHYLVGVVAEDIDVDGTTWAGLSVESPLYEALQGAKVGDEVTVNNRTQKVTLIA